MRDQEYFKEMLLRLGSASDEEGWLVRRQIAVALVTWAVRPYLNQCLCCDPTTGRTTEQELARIRAALKAEIAGSEFDVIVEDDQASRLFIDLFPHSFVHPLERALLERDLRQRVEAAVNAPAYSHEGQD